MSRNWLQVDDPHTVRGPPTVPVRNPGNDQRRPCWVQRTHVRLVQAPRERGQLPSLQKRQWASLASFRNLVKWLSAAALNAEKRRLVVWRTKTQSFYLKSDLLTVGVHKGFGCQRPIFEKVLIKMKTITTNWQSRLNITTFCWSDLLHVGAG